MRTDPAPPKVSRPKWPRQHAQLILAAGNDLARNTLLAKVPAEWLDMVQDHVSQGEARALQHVRQREKFRPSASPAGPAISEYREPVHVPGNAVVAAQHLNALRAALNSSRVNQ
jgi:hypothetical protein